MKKIISIFLLLTLISTLFACTAQQDERKKISGNFIEATTFSEGRALVCVEGTENKTYCIDKNGYIIFEVNENVLSTNSDSTKNIFTNGIALIGKNIYDIDGNVTTPESKDVTTFYSEAFCDKYIIVEKITSDYKNSKKEMGIMNADFSWAVNLSEKFYANGSYAYKDGHIELGKGSGKYLNIESGSIVDSFIPSKSAVINLSRHVNAIYKTDIRDGKAAIVFYNPSVSKCYFTISDIDGNYAFDPVEVEGITSKDNIKAEYDGNYVVISEYTETFVLTKLGYITNHKANIYDKTGKLTGQFDTNDSKQASYDWTLNDGVIIVSQDDKYYHYGDTQGKQLF